MASSSPLSSSQRSPRTFPAMDLDLLLPALLTGAITTHAAAPALGVTVRTVQRHLEAAGGGRPSSARAPAKITRTTLRNCPRCSRRRLRREPWNIWRRPCQYSSPGERLSQRQSGCRLSPCSNVALQQWQQEDGRLPTQDRPSSKRAPLLAKSHPLLRQVPLLAQEEYSCEGSL